MGRLNLALPLSAVAVAGALVTFGVPILPVAAQQAPAQGDQPAQAGRGGDQAGGEGRGAGRGRGGGRGGVTEVPDDTAGFRPLFDGRTLEGWDGDPQFWRVEDGIIVAESTPERVVTDNTFLIWRGGVLRNFELKVDARFAGESGNSGIQVRSRPLTAPTQRSGGAPRPWGIAGYQIDLVPPGGTGTAPLFEEAGRGFVARQGQVIRRVRNDDGTMVAKVIGSLGEGIPDVINPAGEWNSFHVVGIDNVITVFVNGRASAMAIDDDVEGRALEGLLALQMHVGPPFRVEFRNVYLKELPDTLQN